MRGVLLLMPRHLAMVELVRDYPLCLAHFDITPVARPRETKVNVFRPDTVAGGQDSKPICPFGTEQLPKAEWHAVDHQLEGIFLSFAS